MAAAAVALASGALVLGTASVSGAASPSDATRADFVSGNAVNCSQVGFPGSKTAFADGADGINVDGIVGTTTGSKQANIATPLPAGIVIQAVVMKGGPAYNVYKDGSGSVPANYTPLGVVVGVNDDGLASPQNYISPLNGGGNIPNISHWFVCYTGGETPPPPDPEPGTLRVRKAIVNPNNITGLPTEFLVDVICDDGTAAEDLALPADGSFVTVSDDIDANSFCTVIEETPGLPVNTTGTIVVTYTPPEAENNGTNDGVEVPEGGTADVTVTNSYASVQVQVAAAVVTQPRFTG